MLDVLLSPFRFVFHIFQLIFLFLASIISTFGGERKKPIDEINEFCDYFQNLQSRSSSSPSSSFTPSSSSHAPSSSSPTSPSNELFERCTYGQLMNAVRKEPQYVILFFNDPSDKHCLQFSKTVLSDLSFQFLLRERCKAWGCHITSNEGVKVARSLKVRWCPCICLIGFKMNQPTLLVKLQGLSGEITSGALMSKLIKYMDDNQGYLYQAKMDRMEQLSNQSLREQQDSEYLQSLKVDQEKERLKKEKEEEKRRMEEERLEKHRSRTDLREMLRTKLINEPDTDIVTECTRCLIRLPNGLRLDRRFHMDSPIEQLYIFLMLQESSPNEFRINTNFPRREIPPPKFLSTNQVEDSISGSSNSSSGVGGDMTFKQFGFNKTEALFVIDLEA